MNIDPSFFLTVLVVVLIPGTGALFTISTGIAEGRVAAVWAALGCTLGIVPHLLATIFGSAALLHASALAFQCVKYAGVAYLFYLAFSALRDESAINMDTKINPKGYLGIISKAVLINLLNPKLTIFFLAFLPQFIHRDGPSHLIQLTTLSLLFMAMTFCVFLVYGIIADKFRSAVLDSPPLQKWMKRATAGAFASMGIKLAYSDN